MSLTRTTYIFVGVLRVLFRISDDGKLKRDALYLESDVLVRSHQSERIVVSEIVKRYEHADGDDAEQTAEEDHHSELETPEGHELFEPE